MKRKAVSDQEGDSSIQLEVSLPSGRSETISVSQCGTLADLKIAAQQSFGQSFLRLAAPDGRLLHAADSLRLSGIHPGDSIAAVAQQPKLAATWHAFALWCVGADRVVTWGSAGNGGDSSRVQNQFRNVQQIYGTGFAFAAILADRTVVTWGHQNYGGDSSRVQEQLKNVQQISGTHCAFAAILADGSVVTWGQYIDSSRVQDQLKSVQQISGTSSAFAAILADGTVVTWGSPYHGGDSSRVKDQLRDVQQISGACCTFAAILANGTVVTWGDPNLGGDSSRVRHQLRDVHQISGTGYAFAAILSDRTVVTWGCPNRGGDSSRVKDQLRDVQQICCAEEAFAAILGDGTVVTWGIPNRGGDSSRVRHQLKDVQQISGTGHAFAAILSDRTVVTWGCPNHGGDSSRVQDQLRDVQKICCTRKAFAAILADGTVSLGAVSSATPDWRKSLDAWLGEEDFLGIGSALRRQITWWSDKVLTPCRRRRNGNNPYAWSNGTDFKGKLPWWCSVVLQTRVLDSAGETDAVCFGTALAACTPGGRWQEAQTFLRRCRTARLRNDAAAYGAAVSAAAAAAVAGVAEGLLEDVRQRDVEPSQTLQNILATAIAWDSALHFLAPGHWHLRCDAVSSNVLAKACAQAQQWQLSAQRLRDMRRQSLERDARKPWENHGKNGDFIKKDEDFMAFMIDFMDLVSDNAAMSAFGYGLRWPMVLLQLADDSSWTSNERFVVPQRPGATRLLCRAAKQRKHRVASGLGGSGAAGAEGAAGHGERGWQRVAVGFHWI
eukprot:s14_g12.t2